MIYTVRTTKAVAEEMARYEGSHILNSDSPKTPEWCVGDPEMESMYTTYSYEIEGIPNYKRWASYQITDIQQVPKCRKFIIETMSTHYEFEVKDGKPIYEQEAINLWCKETGLPASAIMMSYGVG